MKVYKECCSNCLLSKDKIVSGSRAKEIISKCIQEQSFFICHKASINNEQVCCKSFYDNFGDYSQLVRIAQRLNCIEFIDLPNNEKLIPYSEQKNKR